MMPKKLNQRIKTTICSLLFTISSQSIAFADNFPITKVSEPPIPMQVAAFFYSQSNTNYISADGSFRSFPLDVGITIDIYDFNTNGCIDYDDSIGFSIEKGNGGIVMIDKQFDGLRNNTADQIMYVGKDIKSVDEIEHFPIDEEAQRLYINLIEDLMQDSEFKKDDFKDNYCSSTPRM